jgi:hypothetical protein
MGLGGYLYERIWSDVVQILRGLALLSECHAVLTSTPAAPFGPSQSSVSLRRECGEVNNSNY